MTFGNLKIATARGIWSKFQWLACVLLLGATFGAHAENCSDYPNGILDGATGTVAPSQLNIDRTCTIRNFPASNPLSTNISFSTQPGQTDLRWLVIFDNVVHTGQMACNAVAGHKIWFTNGSSTGIHDNCQNLLIPVEKIDKKNPAGQTTATIGVPFTYKLTIPILYDPGTSNVIDFSGSPNQLHTVVITDDLNATGADLTYISHVAYWKDSGDPVPLTFSNAGGLLTFAITPVIPVAQQLVIEITVVLDDSPANVLGTQFINTAKWSFGRLIDDIFYSPLPGEWGITPPMTIAAPELVVTKTGPATMNLGQWGQFTLDAHNTGLTDAWNVSLLDRLPDGANGGMCSVTPQVLSARVFAADGVTPVPGKGPLVAGTDFSVGYTGAPTCELTLSILTDAGAIGPDQRLVVTYRTQLDPDSQNGATFTNVAGAVTWFNANSTVAGRRVFNRTLTNGTVGTLDFQDAHTVAVSLSGYFFEKTVANRTSGVSPATTAIPGDTLRYTLRIQNTSAVFNNVRLYDELDALNAVASFAPGTLVLVTPLPAGAINNSSATGGAKGTGVIDISNLLIPAGTQLLIQFDVRLATLIPDGAIVANQSAVRLPNGTTFALSDDPNVNGQADPTVAGDEDPTRLVVQLPPPSALLKANTRPTASIGEVFTYRITVPSVPDAAPLYNVRILDDLTASAADLSFVSVTKISGSQAWTPVNTGTSTALVIEDPTVGIDIPAGQQVTIEVAVRLQNTATNVVGLQFTNTASYLYNRLNASTPSVRPGNPGTTAPMTIVGPEQLTVDKNGPADMSLGVPATFTLDVNNPSAATAWGITLTDVLPNPSTGGMCDVAPTQVTARVFQADGVTAVSAPLVAGTDFTVAYVGDPTCTLRVSMISAAAAVPAGNRLIVTYQAQLDAGTPSNAMLTNVGGATQWFSADPLNPATAGQAVTYTRVLTDGTVGVLDHEDAHTIAVPSLRFEKTVANLTTGANPATQASPGDRLRYSLRIENLGDSQLDGFTLRDEIDRLDTRAAFVPGTLTLVTVPTGVDSSNTSGTGGAKGTGLVEVRNLTLPPSGGSVLIEFEVTLAPVLANGSAVLNQSQFLAGGAVLALSDDPNVNGAADPSVAGDEDPTRVVIVSAPAFRVLKISTDLSGDPNVLLAGETLRYTITVQNVGTDNASDVVLRDQIPVNTAYVVGSTRLNGTAVADLGGQSPLVNGMSINSPAGAAAGAIPVNATATPASVATITFDVIVDATVVDGTVISNQGFVSSVIGSVTDRPSDDPATSLADDPTRDIVGNLPLLYAEKRVVLSGDQGSPGIVDPGDVLRYTITVQNSAAIAATGIVLTDAVPASTTYVADSTVLNGAPYGRPDGGASPLAGGITIGKLAAGGTAVVQFDLRVNPGTAAGTVISNQAVASSVELPNLLTDGDGNPATGPEPTEVVVGDIQRLTITKEVAVVGGGPAIAGAQLEYTVRAVNIASVPASNVVITDNLDASQPGQLSYVVGSATLNGSAAGVTFVGSTLTANYSAVNGLQPGQSLVLRFRATLNANLAIGTRVTNTGIVNWSTPTQTASASVSIDVGGVPGVGVLNGAAWHDANFDDLQGAGERALAGWTVELYRDDQLLYSALSDANGTYRISGLVPNVATATRYELRFRAPGAGSRTALLGRAASPFTNALQRITGILVPSGGNLQGLNLPIDPNGVVYNAITRTPVPGATLTLLSAGSSTPLPSSCLDDAAQQGQVTLGDGFYKFDLNFSDPSCPSGGDYLIAVTAPGANYVAGYSQIIPPTSSASTPALSVPSCPATVDDAIPTTSLYCEAQSSESAPATSVAARSTGTNYFAHLRLDGSQSPGSSQIFNNHIPLDPELSGALAITKKTPLLNVTRGQLVPYTINVNNVAGLALTGVNIVDRFPAGFTYVEGSARLDGVPTEPSVAGRELTWTGITIAGSAQHTVQLLLAVGAGVSEGEYVNRAQVVLGITGNAISGEATATVRLVPDPTFDCTDVTGKVFDDANRNGTQDPGEQGLPGVRVATARGLTAVTDQYGRYHITCAVTPNEGRGSNFVMKLDDRTLPSGFRITNDQVQTKRATRGKALRFNFGASIHRVVGIDLADAVFEPGTTDIRIQWRPRLDLLLEELRKAPAILRLSYVADIEDPALVDRRVAAVKKRIAESWEGLNCCYALTIEPEIFWRLGAPPKQQPAARVEEGR